MFVKFWPMFNFCSLAKGGKYAPNLRLTLLLVWLWNFSLVRSQWVPVHPTHLPCTEQYIVHYTVHCILYCTINCNQTLKCLAEQENDCSSFNKSAQTATLTSVQVLLRILFSVVLPSLTVKYYIYKYIFFNWLGSYVSNRLYRANSATRQNPPICNPPLYSTIPLLPKILQTFCTTSEESTEIWGNIVNFGCLRGSYSSA